MTLTLQDAIDRLQQNEERVDAFVNDPAAAGHFITRLGTQVPTIPALIEEARQSTAVLGQANGAANVGYQPAEGEPTTVQEALRTLEEGGASEPAGTAATLVANHAADPDPHPQYATGTALSSHQLAADPHPQYATQA